MDRGGSETALAAITPNPDGRLCSPGPSCPTGDAYGFQYFEDCEELPICNFFFPVRRYDALVAFHHLSKEFALVVGEVRYSLENDDVFSRQVVVLHGVGA